MQTARGSSKESTSNCTEAVKDKETLTKRIAEMGLWTSTMEMEDGLDDFVTKSKKAALKLQERK